MLGLRFCTRAFSSCGERGPLFIAVRGPLTIAASLVAEHRLQTRRLSSCGLRAQSLRGMWDLPRPGLEPMSPALAGRLSITCATREAPRPIYFKELAPVIMEVGKSKSCRLGQQARDPGKSGCCSFDPVASLEAEFLSWGTSIFFSLKTFH